MGMFDKLFHKGKQMAGEYVKDQLSQRSGQQRNTGQQPGGSYGGQRGADGYGQPGNYGGSGALGNYGQAGNYGQPANHGGQGGYPGQGNYPAQGTDADRAAIAKYKYMLRTAPPEDMERAHAEAFARLTPQQRSMLQAELSGHLPPSERPRSDQPADLARAATRAEVSRPGFMEKLLGRGSGRGMGGSLAGGLGAGLLAGVAGAFIGTAIAGPLLDGFSEVGDGIADAAGGLGEDVTAAGEELSAAGEGFTDQAGEVADQGGGFFGGFFDGGGGDSGDFDF